MTAHRVDRALGTESLDFDKVPLFPAPLSTQILMTWKCVAYISSEVLAVGTRQDCNHGNTNRFNHLPLWARR
jgi:hypothetical protein